MDQSRGFLVVDVSVLVRVCVCSECRQAPGQDVQMCWGGGYGERSKKKIQWKYLEGERPCL